MSTRRVLGQPEVVLERKVRADRRGETVAQALGQLAGAQLQGQPAHPRRVTRHERAVVDVERVFARARG
jgi:hypothetical protein